MKLKIRIKGEWVIKDNCLVIPTEKEDVFKVSIEGLKTFEGMSTSIVYNQTGNCYESLYKNEPWALSWIRDLQIKTLDDKPITISPDEDYTELLEKYLESSKLVYFKGPYYKFDNVPIKYNILTSKIENFIKVENIYLLNSIKQNILKNNKLKVEGDAIEVLRNNKFSIMTDNTPFGISITFKGFDTPWACYFEYMREKYLIDNTSGAIYKIKDEEVYEVLKLIGLTDNNFDL